MIHEGPYFLLKKTDHGPVLYVLPSVTDTELRYLKDLERTHDSDDVRCYLLPKEGLEAYMYVAAALEENEDSLFNEALELANREECKKVWDKWTEHEIDFLSANVKFRGIIQGVFFLPLLAERGL